MTTDEGPSPHADPNANAPAANSRQALIEAAADHALTEGIPPLTTPGMRELCAAAGVGASTFYRYFDSHDDYSHALVIHHLNTAYRPGRSATAAAANELDLDANEVLSDNDLAEIVRNLSNVFSEDDPGALESRYLPWVGDDIVAGALTGQLQEATEEYAEIMERFARSHDREILTDAADLMTRVTAVTIAANLVGAEHDQPPATRRTVSKARADAQAELVVALSPTRGSPEARTPED